MEHEAALRGGDLGHMREADERRRIEDAVTVALGLGPNRRTRLRPLPRFEIVAVAPDQHERPLFARSGPRNRVWHYASRSLARPAVLPAWGQPDNQLLVDDDLAGVDKIPEGD